MTHQCTVSQLHGIIGSLVHNFIENFLVDIQEHQSNHFGAPLAEDVRVERRQMVSTSKERSMVVPLSDCLIWNGDGKEEPRMSGSVEWRGREDVISCVFMVSVIVSPSRNSLAFYACIHERVARRTRQHAQGSDERVGAGIGVCTR